MASTGCYPYRIDVSGMMKEKKQEKNKYRGSVLHVQVRAASRDSKQPENHIRAQARGVAHEDGRASKGRHVVAGDTSGKHLYSTRNR